MLRAASCRMPLVGKSKAHTLAPADFIQSHSACRSSTQRGIDQTCRGGAELPLSGAASGEGQPCLAVVPWLQPHAEQIGLDLATAVPCSMSQAGHSERGQAAVSCRGLSAGTAHAD